MVDVITPILNMVSVLCSCTGNNRCFYLLDLKENKDALRTAMEELKDTRDDVKRRVDEAENDPNEAMKCKQEVSGWLQRVQTIEGEVDEIIEKANQEIEGRCFGGYCPKNCWSARKIGKLVSRKLPIVKDLRNKGSFGDVAYRLPPSIVQKVPVDLTVGMESLFDKVWKSLAEDEVRIMGLFGQGGVGKTTLLTQINNEFLKDTTHGFDVVIYVVVSNTLNIDAIQREIGTRLGLSLPDRRSIFNTLTKKNFVLLLDDIWERVDLQSIGIPRPENRKSKVIFTTRSETVCGLMEANKKFKVKCLPWNEAWTLFQNKVGYETLNSHPNIPELAKLVAQQCGCLPLALITIGRAMSSKKTVREWNHAITTLQKSASEIEGMDDKVFPLLRLSYDSLRNDKIKSCFLYCALFPEDHSINKSKLVDYWIGEGLILLDESDNIDDARNHGYNVIGILKGACLLETGKDAKTEVKMHDMIRDLALWISDGIKKDQMMIARASEHTSERLWSNAERIYCYFWRIDCFEIKIEPPKSPNLRTLLFKDAFMPSIPNNFFVFMPLLRVLDLSSSRIEIFPTSITELIELQYLNLSETRLQVIPEELRKLVKLRHLDLSHMFGTTKIPSGVISSLQELRVLNLYSFESGAEWDIEEGYSLKYLNDLRIFINTQQNLNKLLSNQNLLKCIRHLKLLKVKPISPSSSRIRALEEFDLVSNLETLSIDYLHDAELNHCYYYYYLEQQQQLGSCFQNLSQISIWYCSALKDLTWAGYVGNLKTLVVTYCNELEEIVKVADDFGGRSTGGEDEIAGWMNNVFKRLEILTVKKLPKLKSICRNALAFPCLEFFYIGGCPQLKKLPFDYGTNVNNTLRMIQGEQKWWNELQWEEEGHDNNELKSKFLPHFVDSQQSTIAEVNLSFSV